MSGEAFCAGADLLDPNERVRDRLPACADRPALDHRWPPADRAVQSRQLTLLEGDVAPIAVIDGLHQPQRVFVDSFLNIFVSNKGDNTISVFENDGPTTLDANGTLSDDAVKDPRGVVTDSTGRVIVGVPGELVFFPPNSKGIVQPVAILSLGQGLDPAGISIR